MARHSLMAQTKIFWATLSGSTKTGGVPLPCILIGCVTSSYVLVVAFPWKVSTGQHSQTRPFVPSFTMLKWRYHLNKSFYQFSEHRIKYRHCNGHLKASKQGAFLLTQWPWHPPDWPEWATKPAKLHPLVMEGHKGKFGCVPSGLCRLTKARHQVMVSLAMAWVRQHRPLLWPVCQQKSPPVMPLNGHCNACTWSYVLKIGRKIHLSSTFILAKSE